MCGICGQYNFGSHEPVQREDIVRMTRTLAHRGPDDEGFYFDGDLGLGFRRLSIIDLEGGHQPMSDAEEAVWVVFNGEIYNYRELRRELQSFGYEFRTQSDTEVIVHGYKRWGDGVLDHLNGMFGLAVWDTRRRRLMLARDRFGIKLIYYRLEHNCLLFGSEMRAVRALDKESTDVDPLALNLLLRYRYTPSPYTLNRNIRKLAPGTQLVVEKETVRVERWYKYKPRQFLPPKREDDVLEELRELYRQAVARHLNSDVPLGLLLSGGVDSALLLALMKEKGDGWPTYTVGYGKGFRDDELDDAAETASILKEPNSPVQIDKSQFDRMLPLIVSCLEEPIAASSIVPMYFVCQRAREDIKVALIGQGPDELFGGYKRHLGVRYGYLWRALPDPVRCATASVIQRLPRQETLKRGINSLGCRDRMKRYSRVFALLPESRINSLFHKGLLEPDTDEVLLKCWSELSSLLEDTDELGGLQFIELRSSLPDELLMYADKLSMAHGLELRVPYIDKEIVEYVECLASTFKIRNATRKWLHRRICRHYLPRRIIKRRKRGFAVNVVDSWYRQHTSATIEKLLDRKSLLYEYLSYEKVSEIIKDHIEGVSDHHKVIFCFSIVEEWLRHNISEA